MNEQLFRVVFNESLGAWVAVSEATAARGKRSRGRSARRCAAQAAAGALILGASTLAIAQRAPLPVQSTSETRTRLNSGNFSVRQPTGTRMEIDQRGANAVINWDSFDIANGHTVRFNHETSASKTLNRIWDGNPSQIDGAIEALGQVYLVNRNGILFGPGAQINVGGLVASALNLRGMTDDPATNSYQVFENGYLTLSGTGNAAFEYVGNLPVDGQGRLAVPTVGNAGSITAAEGGSVMMFAPRVENSGRIETTSGQVVLAAGQKIYLMQPPSSDTSLRGVLVEVDPFAGGSAATSSASNTGAADAMRGIIANRGNITLAAMAVNNDGLLRATSGKLENGSIYLQGRGGVIQRTETVDGVQRQTVAATRGGVVELGAGSRIEAEVEDITEAEVTAQAQARLAAEEAGRPSGQEPDSEAVRASRLEALKALIRKQYTVSASEQLKPAEVAIDGRSVWLRSGSIVAPAATVSINAEGERLTAASSVVDRGARVVMEGGAIVDVSGYDNVAVDGARNQISAILVSNELKDAPLQRDGVLYRQKVSFNLLDDPDGKFDVADMSGYTSGVQRSLRETSTRGGSIALSAEGDVIVGQGARLDVSGGSAVVSDAYIETTVLHAGKRRFDLTEASAERRYDKTSTRTDLVRGYTEGGDAGAITISARGMSLEGSLQGATTAGRLQRSSGDLPQGGALTLRGPLADGVVQATDAPSYRFSHNPGRVDAGFWADPLNASAGNTSLVSLSPELFASGGFTRVTAEAGGDIVVEAGAPLQLQRNSKLTLRAEGDIRIEDDIRGVGATVNAAATRPGGDLTLADGKRIDVSGEWVNDWNAVRTRQERDAGSVIDGGTVSLSASDDLRIGQGAVIDVSGGARLDSSGEIAFGDAGDITLARTGGTDYGRAMQIQGTLRGTAMGLVDQAGEGGSLTLSDSAIRVGGAARSNDELALDPAMFAEGGFSHYTLEANRGNLTVEPGAQLVVRRSIDHLANYRNAQTGAPRASMTRSAQLAAHVRDPRSLTLRADGSPAQGERDAANWGRVDVAREALLDVGAGGTITVEAARQLTVAGTLRARGGSVDLAITEDGQMPTDSGFHADQSIFLTHQARLDVSGVALVQTDQRGRRSGEVLDGGSISLEARKGYVVAQSGAQLQADGAGGTIDQRSISRNGVTLVSQGGSIAMSAREGILSAAGMSARSGGAGAAGGSLSMTLGLGSPSAYGAGQAQAAAYPDDPARVRERIVHVSAGTATQEVARQVDHLAAGDALPVAADAAHGHVDVARLAEGGFDSVSIKSDDTIRLEGTGSLSAAQALTLDAPVLALAGGADFALRSSHVALQYGTDPRASYARTTERQQMKEVEAGTGRLEIQAGLVDVSGSVGISGTQFTRMHGQEGLSLEALRLNGTVVAGKEGELPQYAGNLNVAGSLSVEAAQVYPSTLTSFALNVAGAAGAPGVLEIRGNGSAAPVPLSAGGALTLSADDIVQAGVLRAPFGTLNLEARNSLVLAAGSVTSASAEGTLIPFGTLENNTNWNFAIPDSSYSRGITQAPQATVKLQAPSVEQQAGSRINLSGGGDLYAHEFVAGPGGSTDVLDAPGTYAVLPGYASHYAPYDPVYGKGFDQPAGTRITLAAGGGLPAGTYTLLPARYALLPGAYKVRQVDGDIQDGGSAAHELGGAQVSGRLSVTGTGQNETLPSRWLVESGVQTRMRSQYNEALASRFLRDRAARGDYALLQHVADAGRLVVLASDALRLEGEIDFEAAEREASLRGKGGQLDLSLLATGRAQTLRIGTSSDDNAQDDVLNVSGEALAAVGADSVVLGGVRSLGDDTARLSVDSKNVVVDLPNGWGAAGAAPRELVVAARESVTVSGNTRLAVRADDGSATLMPMTVAGDGALLRLATGGADVTRSEATGAAGSIDIQAGARLVAEQVQVDATRDTAVSRDARIEAAALTLGAARIAFGEGSSGNGVMMAGELLDGVATNAEALKLRSYGGFDFDSSIAFGAGSALRSLTLDGPAIRWTGTGAGNVEMVANTLTITNTTGAVAADRVATPGATLAVRARGDAADGGDLRIESGDVRLLGFETSTLGASRALTMAGRGNLVAQGDLTLRTALITGEAGARQTLTATGNLRTEAIPAGEAVQPGGGATVALRGASVDHGTRFEIASGSVSLEATQGDLRMRDGATLGAYSASSDFNGQTVTADAGSAKLIAGKGDVIVEAGARVDVSGRGDSSAGRLSVLVPEGQARFDGQLLGGVTADGASAGARGGEFSIDTQSLQSLDVLNVQTAGFTGARRVRLRQGDLSLSAGEGNALVASEVVLQADAGNVDVQGTIDASGEEGGYIELAARRSFVTQADGSVQAQGGMVRLGPQARLLAAASGAGERGGTVIVSVGADDARVINGVTVKPADDTRIELAAGSVINVQGGAADAARGIAAGEGGKVTLRAPRITRLSDYSPVSGATSVAIEPSVFTGPPAPLSDRTPGAAVAGLGAGGYVLASGTNASYVVLDPAYADDAFADTDTEYDRVPLDARFRFVAGVSNARNPAMSMNGSPEYRLVTSLSSLTLNPNQLVTGATYEVQMRLNANGERVWLVQNATPLGSANARTVLDVDALVGSLLDGSRISFSPTAGSFAGGDSNLTGNVYLQADSASPIELRNADGLPIGVGNLLSGSSYVARFVPAQGGDARYFQLLSPTGGQSTYVVNDARLPTTPPEDREILLEVTATNNGAVWLAFDRNGQPAANVSQLFDTQGRALQAGVLEAGKTYSIGRLSDGRYALRPGAGVYQIDVAGAGDQVAFTLPSVTAPGTAADVRLKLGSNEAAILRNIDGSAMSAAQLQAGVFYLARREGGVWRLQSTSDLESNVPVQNGGVSIVGARQVDVEAVKSYQAATLDNTLRTRIQTDNNAYAAWLPGVAATLALDAAGARVSVRPGVEIRSEGDLELDADWNFAATQGDGQPLWRYGSSQVAGSLTLRAAGNLLINGQLSDGFSAFTPLQHADNWSYTLVAGADLSAASATTAAGDGDLVVRNTVRTGVGNITLAAGGDIDMASPAATVYTAGRRTSDAAESGIAAAVFTSGGGDLVFDAGANILGNASTELPTRWLWRRGAVGSRLPAWWVSFQNFSGAVGALGGGGVRVRAGADIANLNIAVPTQGKVVAAGAGTAVEVRNGGDLDLRAGGDLLGGQYLVDRGRADMAVAGSVLPGDARSSSESSEIGAVLYAGQTQFRIAAGADLVVDTITSPTAVTQSRANTGNSQSYLANFLRYDADSSLELRSAAGDVVMRGLYATRSGVAESDAYMNTDGLGLFVAPASVRMVAPSGNVDLRGFDPAGSEAGLDLRLFPSARGQLELYAGGSVMAAEASGVGVVMDDRSPADLPSALAPVRDFVDAAPSTLTGLLHADDMQVARIVAREGDVSGNFTLPKAVEVSAGRDVRNLGLNVTHVRDTDTTVISAGRDLIAPQMRDAFNNILPSVASIDVYGPGVVEITSGRDVDLGTSRGVVSHGPGSNAYLPDGGAAVRIVAGKPASVDAAVFAESLSGDARTGFLAMPAQQQLAYVQTELLRRFIATYGLADGAILPQAASGGMPAAVAPGAANYRAQWLDFAARNGLNPERPEAADGRLMDRFRYQVLWQELSASGREGGAIRKDAESANPSKKYSADDLLPEKMFARGYTAIELAGLGPAFKLNGNMRLVFSQVRSMAGGDIDIMVPGGSLDVGATAPVPGFSKGPGELGLVATEADSRVFVRDSINVNISRWMALDGGNLFGWASLGNIDAGRGSRTAVSSSQQRVDVDPATGRFRLVDAGGATGSGIATIFNRPLSSGGDIELHTPNGVVNAGEAGITSGGQLVFSGTVLGADLVTAVGGGAPSAPPPPAAPSVQLGSSAADAATVSESLPATAAGNEQTRSILTVEVVATNEGGAEQDCTPGSPGCAAARP